MKKISDEIPNTIYLSLIHILTLAKLNAETGKLEIVGGSYDAKANAVVGYVAEEGSYFVVEKEGLTTISMQIGNKHVALNNENKILDAAPLISQNRTMVPLRFIAEAFGADAVSYTHLDVYKRQAPTS